MLDSTWKFGWFVRINLVLMVPKSLKEKGLSMRTYVPIFHIIQSGIDLSSVPQSILALPKKANQNKNIQTRI